MATQTQATIVFAPGAWHTPDCFELARNALHARGWTTEAIAYATVGAEPPNKGLQDDAAVVRAVLQRLSDEGKHIVLVVHSYGGLVGAEAVKGLGQRERAGKGHHGGVIMLVYLAAFVTPAGMSIKKMLGGQFMPWMRFEGDYVYSDTPEVIFYHDVAPDQQTRAIEKLKHHSAASFTDEVSYEPWHDVECMYFFCDEDKALPFPVQEQMAGLLGDQAPRYRSAASHSPFLSKVSDVFEGIELAAEQGTKRAKTVITMNQ